MTRQRGILRVFLDQVFPELIEECLTVRERVGRKFAFRSYENLRLATDHDYGLNGPGYQMLIRIRNDLITGRYSLLIYDGIPYPVFWIGEGIRDGYLFTSNHDLGTKWAIEQLVQDNRNRLHAVMLGCRSGEELEPRRRKHHRMVHGKCGKMIGGGQELMECVDIGKKNGEDAARLLGWAGKETGVP